VKSAATAPVIAAVEAVVAALAGPLRESGWLGVTAPGMLKVLMVIAAVIAAS